MDDSKSAMPPTPPGTGVSSDAVAGGSGVSAPVNEPLNEGIVQQR